MQSKAKTVEQYLAELPAERREILSTVRQLVRENVDADIEEGMQYGMIGYYVPHRVFPDGYHCNPAQPLPFAALASQKNYCSLYLMTIYGEGERWKRFEQEWKKTGKKLDMGKCCIRFKRVEDLALELIAKTLRETTVRKYVAAYQEALAGTRSGARARKAASARAPAKAPARKAGAKAAVRKPAAKPATRKPR